MTRHFELPYFKSALTTEKSGRNLKALSQNYSVTGEDEAMIRAMMALI